MRKRGGSLAGLEIVASFSANAATLYLCDAGGLIQKFVEKAVIYTFETNHQEGPMVIVDAACVINGAPMAELRQAFLWDTVSPQTQALCAASSGVGQVNHCRLRGFTVPAKPLLRIYAYTENTLDPLSSTIPRVIIALTLVLMFLLDRLYGLGRVLGAEA